MYAKIIYLKLRENNVIELDISYQVTGPYLLAQFAESHNGTIVRSQRSLLVHQSTAVHPGHASLDVVSIRTERPVNQEDKI